MKKRSPREYVAQYVAALENPPPDKVFKVEERGVPLLTSQPIKEAFLKVERHRFLEGFYRWDTKSYQPFDPEDPPPELLEEIYSLWPILIKISPFSSCSDPPLVAGMLELLKLKKGMRILEIGGGTGYNAALMAEIVGEQGLVITLEIQSDIAEKTKRRLPAAGYGEKVYIYHQDGFCGWSEESPYDRIVATTCCFDVSPYWFDQLSEGGWMLIPLRHGTLAPLTQIFKDGRGRFLASVGFCPAQGGLSDPGLWSRPTIKVSEAKELPWPFPKKLKKDPFWGGDFDLFIGLNRLKAISLLIFRWSEKEGWRLLVDNEKVDELYKLLKVLYKEFAVIGSPRVEDYQIEFTLCSHPSPSVKRIGPKEWVIERKYTSQRIWLPK